MLWKKWETDGSPNVDVLAPCIGCGGHIIWRLIATDNCLKIQQCSCVANSPPPDQPVPINRWLLQFEAHYRGKYYGEEDEQTGSGATVTIRKPEVQFLENQENSIELRLTAARRELASALHMVSKVQREIRELSDLIKRP